MQRFTLGFANMFYTLWLLDEPFKVYSDYAMGQYELKQLCHYRYNLSTDYNKAIEKIKDLSGDDYDIDLSLRGSSSFNRILSSGNDLPEECFTFGKYAGEKIMLCDDTWQLKRAMTEERGKRRRVYARRRLIDLGELVRNTIGAGDDNYINASHFQWYKEKQDLDARHGHVFENGKRIELSLKCIKEAGFLSFNEYKGEIYIFVNTYEDEQGRLFIYKGENPPKVSQDDFTKVKGTIEHTEYKGVKQTRLKRIILLTPKPQEA